MKPQPLSLVADIGGTNSRFALAKGGQLLDGSVWRTPNNRFGSFEAALSHFLAGREAPARACIAAAGPVLNGAVTLTNHDWSITPASLCINEVHLLNDMQALGHALAPLGPPDKRKLVVNIGTGFNAAVLHCLYGVAYVPPCEAGHMRLPALPQAETALARCRDAYGSDALEAVLSGAGLERLHMALTGEALAAQNITEDWPKPTLDALMGLLGHSLGDLALTHLPEGGIWLAGSVGRLLADQLSHPAFGASFASRGPYSDLVKLFKISPLQGEVAALEGAALYLHGHAAPA